MQKADSIVFVLAVIFIFQGCETFPRAREGFKNDWKQIKEVDSFLKEILW